MNDIEILREAARQMRERAQAATPSPTEEPYGWAGHSGTIGAAIYGGPAENGYRTSTVLAVEPCTTCTPPTDANVQHIIGWHPAVALAIADWLDAAAQREQEHRQRSAHHAYADPSEGDEVYGALIVAKAYLGVAS